MKHGVRDRVVAEVARLVAARPGIDVLIDEADGIIGRAIPHVAACWHTLDPMTLIVTRTRGVHISDHEHLVAEIEYAHGDYNHYSGLARSRRHAAILTEAAGDPQRSWRYRELFQPIGVHGELRTSLVDGRHCWGAAAFVRSAPDDFTQAERDLAHDLSAVLARGFRAAMLPAPTDRPVPAPAPGLVLLDGQGQVESVAGGAPGWLAELGDRGAPDDLPHAVRVVAAAARATAVDTTACLPTGCGRWVHLHASPASGKRGRVAIILQSPPPASLVPLIAAAYGLTRRERELTELVLQGHPTNSIAGRLCISPYTVQEHLKSIFNKIGVRSRRELIGLIFERHYQPTVDRTRGVPYGE